MIPGLGQNGKRVQMMWSHGSRLFRSRTPNNEEGVVRGRSDHCPAMKGIEFTVHLPKGDVGV